MKDTVTVKTLHGSASAVIRKARSGPVSVTRYGETVAFVLSREHVESLLETVEVLANPEAMKAIRAADKAKPGSGKTLNQLEREIAREENRKAA